MKKLQYIDLESVEHISNEGYILANRYTHKIFQTGLNAIHDLEQIDRVDDKDWEIFSIKFETVDAYYGIPLIGFGLLNCRIEKVDAREFLPHEVRKLNTLDITMIGSHSGKKSYGYSIDDLSASLLKSRWESVRKETNY